MKYRMTEEEYQEVLEASKPVIYMVIGGMPPESPREKAMRVWGRIAERVGCKVNTIGPADTGDMHDFVAEKL